MVILKKKKKGTDDCGGEIDRREVSKKGEQEGRKEKEEEKEGKVEWIGLT